MAKVGVLLSGCGVYDGSEIHEAVITMLALDRAGAEIVCMAPNKNQHHVINHLTMEQMNETRNVLVESARIARGNIRDLKTVTARDIDALIMPGGFGAAKNLSDFAFKGPQAQVDGDVERLLKEMVQAKKPIGAICISPATVALALGSLGPILTVGNDAETIGAIEALGGRHRVCMVHEIAVDEENRIVTTPAYMLGPGIKEVASGIESLVARIMAMIT
jgi:enhancing lycopene biosynthesis protein 2